MDDEVQELEYVIDAYVKVWATSYEEAMERADKALAEMYGKHSIEVETFDAYGINGPDGEETRPVS
jgi:hypothetical protein